MATTEERFASLESFRTETIKAYGEMAMELAMVKGLTSDAIGRLAVVQRDVSELKTQVSHVREEMLESFSLLQSRLNMMHEELTNNTLLLHQLMQRLDEKK